jgi:hypothetical protein
VNRNRTRKLMIESSLPGNPAGSSAHVERMRRRSDHIGKSSGQCTSQDDGEINQDVVGNQ